MAISIWHNPRCSKSRDTMTLLQDKGISPEVVHYLDQPPTADEIRALLVMLSFDDARQLIRKSEAEYKALALDAPGQTQDALIDAMVAHPRLIERPIVINGSKAAIGRPPEAVLEIL